MPSSIDPLELFDIKNFPSEQVWLQDATPSVEGLAASYHDALRPPQGDSALAVQWHLYRTDAKGHRDELARTLNEPESRVAEARFWLHRSHEQMRVERFERHLRQLPPVPNSQRGLKGNAATEAYSARVLLAAAIAPIFAEKVVERVEAFERFDAAGCTVATPRGRDQRPEATEAAKALIDAMGIEVVYFDQLYKTTGQIASCVSQTYYLRQNENSLGL